VNLKLSLCGTLRTLDLAVNTPAFFSIDIDLCMVLDEIFWKMAGINSAAERLGSVIGRFFNLPAGEPSPY